MVKPTLNLTQILYAYTRRLRSQCVGLVIIHETTDSTCPVKPGFLRASLHFYDDVSYLSQLEKKVVKLVRIFHSRYKTHVLFSITISIIYRPVCKSILSIPDAKLSKKFSRANTISNPLSGAHMAQKSMPFILHPFCRFHPQLPFYIYLSLFLSPCFPIYISI